MSSHYRERVARYYDVNQTGFDILWSRDYLRYGLWDSTTRTLRDALQNVDRFVADALQLTEGEVVLDAGCGVGGSAIFLARSYGVRVVGVNICKSQLEKAQRKLRVSGVDHLVRFEEQDFSATGFADRHFAKLYAIESFYHAEDVAGFASEAYRLLRGGGRIVVVDRFLLQEAMTTQQRRLYDQFKAGQVVAGLTTVDRFRETMEAAGFVNLSFIDQKELVKRGIARTHWVNVLCFPLSLISKILRFFPPEVHEQTKGLMAIRQLFAMNVVTYGAIVADKPSTLN